MDKLRNIIVFASALLVTGIIVDTPFIKYLLLTISAALSLYAVVEDRKKSKSS